MKPFIVSRNSWHFKIANTFMFNDYNHSSSFCSYVFSFLFGFIIFTFSLVIFGLMVGLFFVVAIETALPLYFLWKTGFWLGDVTTQISMFALFVFMMVISMPFLSLMYDHIFPNKLWEDSFVVLAYKSYRDKFCPKVIFER